MAAAEDGDEVTRSSLEVVEHVERGSTFADAGCSSRICDEMTPCARCVRTDTTRSFLLQGDALCCTCKGMRLMLSERLSDSV
jgi:hypothetical protein